MSLRLDEVGALCASRSPELLRARRGLDGHRTLVVAHAELDGDPARSAFPREADQRVLLGLAEAVLRGGVNPHLEEVSIASSAVEDGELTHSVVTVVVVEDGGHDGVLAWACYQLMLP